MSQKGNRVNYGVVISSCEQGIASYCQCVRATLKSGACSRCNTVHTNNTYIYIY
jgi:hypothetical protein